jgi:histidine triad (HIT) family protein
MSTIFSKIIKGEIPSYKVAENDEFYAFLDIAPLSFGHTLVVPKFENDYIFDLDDHILQKMFVFAKKVALAVEKNVKCQRIGVAVLGIDVPHTHIHLIPIVTGKEINFSNERINFSNEEYKYLSNNILKTFNQELL